MVMSGRLLKAFMQMSIQSEAILTDAQVQRVYTGAVLFLFASVISTTFENFGLWGLFCMAVIIIIIILLKQKKFK